MDFVQTDIMLCMLICSDLRAVNRVGTLPRELTKFKGKRKIQVGERYQELMRLLRGRFGIFWPPIIEI